jgi:hypothetical protein
MMLASSSIIVPVSMSVMPSYLWHILPQICTVGIRHGWAIHSSVVIRGPFIKNFPCNHIINKKKNLFPAKQKTAQFFPFLFCFTRELNLYTTLTFSLRPPIHPYLTHRPPIPPPTHSSATNPQPFCLPE